MSEKINVLIDCSYIKRKPACPISLHIYAGRLIKGMKDSKTFHPVVLVVKGMESYFESLAGCDFDIIAINGNEKRSVSQKLDRILGLIPRSLEVLLDEWQIKAVVTPDIGPYLNIYPSKYHQHVVIHDLIRIHNFSWTNDFYYHLMFRCITRNVPHLIAISQETSYELKNWCGRESEVIHNSVPFEFCCEEEPVNELQGKPFILDVNRINAYKNPLVLLKAFHNIKDQIPHQLYFKGIHESDCLEELMSSIRQMHLEDRTIIDTSMRTEGEMRWLYTHADLFVTPSLKEGFGYTPIEAAVLKTPVLVSDIPTLREVTQGKLETFDPHLPEELAEKMLKMIANPPSEKEKDDIAMFFLKEYSLEKQIEQFTKVILKNIGLGRD